MLELRNTPTTYGAMARLLHWGMSIMIFGQLALGIAVWEFMERGPMRSAYTGLHFSLGMTILGLLLVRIAWRFGNPPPAPLAGQPPALVLGAKLGHGLLYLLLFALCISGWIAVSSNTAGLGPDYFGWFRWPAIWAPDEHVHEAMETVHKYLAWTLAVVVTGHVAATLYHHVRLKDGTLRRMTG
jgi:cytochrome b561